MEQNQLAVIDRALPSLSNAKEILLANDLIYQKIKASAANIEKAIAANGGKLNADLDQKLMEFITKASKRREELEGARKPITLAMDLIRDKYTEIENDINPLKPASLTAKFQQLRNQYAKELKDDADKKKKEIELKNNKEKERGQMKADILLALNNHMADIIAEKKKVIKEFFESATLENLDQKCKVLKEKSTVWPHTNFPEFKYKKQPVYIPADEVAGIAEIIIEENKTRLMADHGVALRDYIQEILELTETKRNALQEIANADAEKKKQLEKENEERLEKERLESEQKLQEQKNLNEQQSNLAKSEAATLSLFSTHSESAEISHAVAGGTREKLIIKIKHGAAWQLIFQFWWEREGMTLTSDEMEKKTMKQMKTFCEKAANDKKKPEQIESDLLSYVEDVKAINKAEKTTQ